MGNKSAPESFVCASCSKQYKTRRNYEKHLLTHELTHETAAGTSNIRATEGEASSQDSSVQLYTCKVCNKKLKTARGHRNHELMHLQSGEVAASVAVQDALNPISHEMSNDDELWPEDAVLLDAAKNVEDIVTFFEEEDEEQERLLLAATLGVEADQPVQGGNKQQQKKNKKAPIAKCRLCGTSFQTLDGFLKHKMGHAMSDAVARAPSMDKLCEVSSKICKEVADLIFSENLGAGSTIERQLQEYSCKMKEFAHTSQMQAFLNSLCECLYAVFNNGTKFLLPSHLRYAFLRGVSILLVNKEAKEKLRLQLITALEIQDINVDINFFLVSFTRKFGRKVLAFIIHWMLHNEVGPVRQSEFAVTEQSIESIEFKQVLHYIAGANIKSILRCAWRSWGQNDDCKMIISTLRTNFLISSDDDKDAPDSQFMEWTLSQDRGKLLKINNQALDFFIELASIVKPLEHFDGAVVLDEVIEKVSEGPKILFLWEKLVRESLPTKISFRLLHSLCEYFTNTWRSGVVRRRLDQLQASSASAQPQGTRGVAFRPKVVKFNTNST